MEKELRPEKERRVFLKVGKASDSMIRARPSNTAVRDLLEDERFTEAILDFLRKPILDMLERGSWEKIEMYF